MTVVAHRRARGAAARLAPLQARRGLRDLMAPQVVRIDILRICSIRAMKTWTVKASAVVEASLWPGF